MGVDCRITLPPATRVRDVAMVIGALVGLPVEHRKPDSKYEGFGWASVNKITYKSNSSIPECCNIEWTDLDGEPRNVLYHFEFGDDGCRGMLPRSTPFWLAIGMKLVDFFGGELDKNDSDSVDCDYQKPVRNDISASDGKEWEKFQKRLLAVKPLTRADIDAEKKHASYDRDWKTPGEMDKEKNDNKCRHCGK